MTDLQDLVTAVEGSQAFARFATGAPSHRLVHVFAQKETIELGYYDAEHDAITVFGTNEPITASEPQEVFRDQDQNTPQEALAGLDVSAITVGLADVRSQITRLLAQEYPAHAIAQEILILQQRDDRPVWGVTVLTHTLHVWLAQIDARDGAVRSSEFRNVLDLRAPK